MRFFEYIGIDYSLKKFDVNSTDYYYFLETILFQKTRTKSKLNMSYIML